MDWKTVENDGVPHDATGEETIYVGVNSAGYCGCGLCLRRPTIKLSGPEAAFRRRVALERMVGRHLSKKISYRK